MKNSCRKKFEIICLQLNELRADFSEFTERYQRFKDAYEAFFSALDDLKKTPDGIVAVQD
ncbi:MAG: hypothetical protein ACI4OB_06795 [Christensenellales bacterium]